MLTSIGKLVADCNSEGLHASAGLNLTDLCAAVLGGVDSALMLFNPFDFALFTFFEYLL